MTWTPRLALLCSLCSLAGCKETVDSGLIRTGGIAMLTTVTARSETEATVRTKLVVGGDESNTYVVLDSGDNIYAEVDGDRVEMEAIDDGVYEATFEGNGVGDDGAAYAVMLKRADDDSAEGNEGTLPAPFEITSDFGAASLSRMDDDAVITWEPSGEPDDMSLEVDDDIGGCIFSDSFDIAGDDGSYTIEAGTLDSTSSKEPEECDVTATLARERAGSTDSALDSESWFRLRQIRSVTFASAP